MYALLLLLSALQANPHPPRLPHTWMKLGDSQSVVSGLTITFHHFADMSSASISPENGYRRIWLKDEWHPPKGKRIASIAELVEMDCAGHRSRNLAFEEAEDGFMDNDKTADWQPITTGSMQAGLCDVPASTFDTQH